MATRMLSTESWPQPAARVLTLTRRFQKFLTVGAVGFAVNLGMLYVLVGLLGIAVVAATPLAIFVSMLVTFSLNEVWTWHDRGSGPVVQRAVIYGTINTGGLLIQWGIVVWLHGLGLHYLVASVFGAGVAACWNFGLHHFITWRA
jgi:dolichol-phosphate mannosyltransferase